MAGSLLKLTSLLEPTLWFVGLTTLDVIHRGQAPQHRNQKVTATWQGVSAGGPAANAAVVASVLGARSVLLTALGGSPAAAIARADLEKYGVQVIDLADEAFEFAVSAILVDALSSERSVVSLDGGIWGTRPLPSIDFSSIVHDAAAPTAVLFDGHHPNIARQVATWVGQLANKHQEPLVVLDGGRWKDIFVELIPIADVAALSSDFRVPTQLGFREPQPPVLPQPTVLHDVLSMGCRAAVVTHGAEPVEWTAQTPSGTETGHSIVPKTKAIDTLGAGDAFHGALTYYLATGQSLPEAIAQANQLAATKVKHPGNRDWLRFINGRA